MARSLCFDPRPRCEGYMTNVPHIGNPTTDICDWASSVPTILRLSVKSFLIIILSLRIGNMGGLNLGPWSVHILYPHQCLSSRE